MKNVLKIIALTAAAALLLCSCAARGAQDMTAAHTQAPAAEPEEKTFAPITEIDPCAVEPDELAVMSDNDKEQYRTLMNGMLDRKEEIKLYLAGDRAEFLVDLLRQSPYYFFVSDCEIDGSVVRLSYAYDADEQEEMRKYMDSELLLLANSSARDSDNELDVILKVYSAVARRISYDTVREDNKKLGSPLFDYPADEVYDSLREGKGLCYGFAYIMRSALLQRGIDCFCVYGECRAHDQGHEWIVFRYDGEFFNCDPAWDRSAEVDAKLVHFGKTDAERGADTLEPRPFSEYHYAKYGEVSCTDKRFSVFRGAVGFHYLTGHKYYLEDRNGNGSVFDSQTFEITDL